MGSSQARCESAQLLRAIRGLLFSTDAQGRVKVQGQARERLWAASSPRRHVGTLTVHTVAPESDEAGGGAPVACALGGEPEDRTRKAFPVNDVPLRDTATAWTPVKEQFAVWSINEELIFFLMNCNPSCCSWVFAGYLWSIDE